MTNLKNTAALSVAFSEQGDSLAYASADGSISVYSNSIGNAAAGDTGAAAASLRASAPAFKPASTPPPAARRPMTAPGRIVPSSGGAENTLLSHVDTTTAIFLPRQARDDYKKETLKQRRVFRFPQVVPSRRVTSTSSRA